MKKNNPTKGHKPTEDDKKRMEDLKKEVKDIYDFKNTILNIIGKEKGYKTKKSEYQPLFRENQTIDWLFGK